MAPSGFMSRLDSIRWLLALCRSMLLTSVVSSLLPSVASVNSVVSLWSTVVPPTLLDAPTSGRAPRRGGVAHLAAPRLLHGRRPRRKSAPCGGRRRRPARARSQVRVGCHAHEGGG